MEASLPLLVSLAVAEKVRWVWSPCMWWHWEGLLRWSAQRGETLIVLGPRLLQKQEPGSGTRIDWKQEWESSIAVEEQR